MIAVRKLISNARVRLFCLTSYFLVCDWINREEVQVWKSSVKIERCRYIEASACKTACVNLCKVSARRIRPFIHISHII